MMVTLPGHGSSTDDRLKRGSPLRVGRVTALAATPPSDKQGAPVWRLPLRRTELALLAGRGLALLDVVLEVVQELSARAGEL